MIVKGESYIRGSFVYVLCRGRLWEIDAQIARARALVATEGAAVAKDLVS